MKQRVIIIVILVVIAWVAFIAIRHVNKTPVDYPVTENEVNETRLPVKVNEDKG